MKVMRPSGYMNKEKIKCTKDCVCAYENIRVTLGFYLDHTIYFTAVGLLFPIKIACS